MILNVNTDSVVVLTNKLEKLHRSAFPNAVRGTLNKAAFDVKQRTMPASADKEFEKRQPNFFKANSRVQMAKGWEIADMEAVIGFTESRLKGGNNYAVRDLEQQERGGRIQGRSFIPTDSARGGSNSRPVRPINRLSQIGKLVNSNKTHGDKRKAFLKAAYKAGAGGYVIGNNEKKILWRINSIERVRGRLKIEKTPIYTFEEDRSVQVKATGFMRSASIQSGKKIEQFYFEEAKRQIQKLS